MPAAHFQSESVAHYSVETIEALAQIGGSKSHINPGCRPESKHELEPFQCLYHPAQLCWVKIATQLDAPALGQYHHHCAWTFTIRCAAPTDYFDSHQPFAIGLDVARLYSLSLESSLQRAQRHSGDPAERASCQATSSKLSDKPLDLLPSTPPARFNSFGFRHPPTSAKSATKW
jgi:hypothetical protein